MSLLPPEFYARDALEVALDLLGMRIRRGAVVLRITEVEAYRWPDDSACHGQAGRTPRNQAMWGPGGHAYVYLCYGLHNLLNVVTDREGEAAAVLIRACEPLAGLNTIRRRRGGKSGPELLTGPGKVGAALALKPQWSGHPLFERGGLEILQGQSPKQILHGPRIGIAYALAKHIKAPWRLAVGDSEWVSHRKGLKPKGR